MYILVRALLICFRNLHQDLPGYSVTQRGGWKFDQIFRYSKFSFIVMRKIMLEFSFFISVGYIMFSSKIYRSSHRRCSIKKSVLKNFAKFTGKLMLGLFLMKLQA